MRHFLLKLSVLCLFLTNLLPCVADTSSTQTFIVDVSTSINVTESGSLTSSIDTDTGNLASPLNINFNIVSNANLSNIQLKALVTDSSGNLDNAFYCTNTSTATSIPTYVVLANATYAPTQSSVQNCETSSSTATRNVNSLAYNGTVSIDNSGTLTYNSTSGYFNATVNSGTSNIALSLSTTVKSGTFDTSNYNDENGAYKVQIYLDNIP